MKLTTSKANMIEALNTVSKGMSSRSTLPVLSGILIKAANGKVEFQTTDLEVSISYKIEAVIEEEGSVVVPGRLFTEVIKSLPDSAINIEAANEKVVITCASSSFSLNVISGSDFPRFPEIESEENVYVPAKTLSAMVKKVSKAVSKDEARAVLTGVLLEIEAGTTRLVSTDTYRVAVMEVANQDQREESIQAIIPGKTLDEVSRLANLEQDVQIGISENKIVFVFGNTIFVSRRIEGKFPNWRQLLPKVEVNTIIVETNAIVSAVKRMALLTQGHTPIKLSFNAAKQTVIISARTQDIGNSFEEVAAQISGGDIEIAFNHQYLIDGLSTITADETKIEIQASNKPGIIRAQDDGNYLYLAMPVRLA